MNSNSRVAELGILILFFLGLFTLGRAFSSSSFAIKLDEHFDRILKSIFNTKSGCLSKQSQVRNSQAFDDAFCDCSIKKTGARGSGYYRSHSEAEVDEINRRDDMACKLFAEDIVSKTNSMQLQRHSNYYNEIQATRGDPIATALFNIALSRSIADHATALAVEGEKSRRSILINMLTSNPYSDQGLNVAPTLQGYSGTVSSGGERYKVQATGTNTYTISECTILTCGF